MSRNPYPTRAGFGLRYFRAARAIRNYGLGWSQEEAGMYTRGFDGCFENYDGDAVVWQIMREAQTDETLAYGIRRMGEKVWPQWHAIYTATCSRFRRNHADPTSERRRAARLQTDAPLPSRSDLPQPVAPSLQQPLPSYPDAVGSNHDDFSQA